MKRVFVVILIIILICGTGFLFFRGIKIQKISCANQDGNCTQKLRDEITSISKGNIFETRKKIQETLKRDKGVTDYSIQFNLPLNYEVNVIEDTGMVAFMKPNGEFAVVNKDGEIIDNVKETRLPKVISYYNLTTTELMYTANLMNRLYTFYSEAGNAKISADGLEITNIKNKTVVFPLQGDQDVLLGSLSLILSRLPSVKEASTIKVIDLRYKNPVLR